MAFNFCRLFKLKLRCFSMRFLHVNLWWGFLGNFGRGILEEKTMDGFLFLSFV